METITRSFITLMLTVIFTGMTFAATGAETCSFEKDKYCLEYYNNKTFEGDAEIVKDVESISYDWKGESPLENIANDNFSIRAKASFEFEAGLYNFSTWSDDGVRLIIDDQIVHEDWTNHGRKLAQTEVELTAGTHNITLEYYENSGLASLEFSFEKTVATPELAACVAGDNKFCVDYYPNMTQEGAPAFQETVAYLNKNWGGSSPNEAIPNDKFSAKALGNFNFVNKDYTFEVKGDDGIRLWVDGVLLINAWKNQGATAYTTTVAMTAGTHLVQVDYYENSGLTHLSSSWSYARNVTVTAEKDADRLKKARVYAFSGTKYLGKYATFDEDGVAYIKDVPFGDVSYRVDYRGQHFTAPSEGNDVSVDLSSFGFRDVTVSTTDADKLNKARVYVFDENDKYKSVYGNFNEEGNVTFFLPNNTYKYRVDYRGQWFTGASTADSVNVALADFGFRNVLVDGSADADKLNKKRVYAFNEEGKYQGVWAAFDETGKANLYLPNKSYKYRVDYRGQWFTPVSNAATVDASLSSFGFRNVIVDGSANADLLNKARVYVYDENDKYQSAWSSFDESGKATLYLANKSYKYRVDYRGQWFTPASNATTIDASLANFGFRDVVVDGSANADLLNKARVYVFNEADKYQGVWAAFNEAGKATFYLADKSYKYRVDYRGQWFTPVSNSTAVDASLSNFGFRDVVVDGSTNADLLNKARVYVYDENDKYQGAWTSFDESGKATFYLADKSYKFRVDYRGRWYTPVSNSTNVVASLTSFGFRNVIVDGSANADLLNKARVYVFDENDKYQGIWTSFNESGKATFFLADKTYKYRVDYRGQWFTPASNTTAVDASLANFGFRDVVVDGSANADLLNKARVYVYDENDKYQGVWTSFDETGKANFYLSSKSYKYRVDYRGKWYTPVTNSTTVDASLANFGFRNVEIDGSVNKDLLHKVRVYVFDEANKYQGVWSSFDENGKANFYLSNKNYKYRVDFRGQYFTDASNASKVSAALSNFGFKKVYIDGSTHKSYLHKARVYVFDENDKYQGAWASLDADGKAEILLANKPYKYRVDYRGRWFTDVALPSSTGYWVQIKLDNFGFRNVVIDSGADKDKTYKKRVYAFDENNKYQGVWASFDINGKATMFLPNKSYKYRVDYRGQWYTPVSADALVNVKLSDFGFRDVTIASTLDKATLKGKRVYAYIGDKYQGVYGNFDANGEVKMYLPAKEYRYRVDYIGKHYTQPTEASEVNVALSDFGFHNVTIEASEKPEVLKGKRVYVFKGTSYKGIYGTFADGKVSFNLPSEDFRYRVDYDGQHYSPETSVGEITFNPTTHEFVTEIPEQSVEVTLVQGDSETPISGAKVYLMYPDVSWGHPGSIELDGTIFGDTNTQGVVTLVYKDTFQKAAAYEYLGNIFMSQIIDGKAKIVVPQNEELTLNLKVQDIGLSGVLITVLNADGTSTGISFMTDAEGVAVIKLPPGSDYQLKLTYQGKEYTIDPANYPNGNVDFEAVAGEDAPDYSGLTTLDKLIGGIYKAIDLNADILNISLGFDSVEEIPALEVALQDARDAGIVIVAAAGNEVNETPFWPAASPLTIAVGSVDESMSVSYTKQATWVDVFAPGIGIYTTNKDGDYSYVTGTSFAAPFVSALAAQMLAFNPAYTQEAMLAKMISTGNTATSSTYNYTNLKVIDFAKAMAEYTIDDTVLFTGANDLTSYSPSNGTEVSGDVSFSWNEVLGALSYELWIINADNGSFVDKKTNVTELSTIVSGLQDGNYAWWIRGSNSKGLTDWSEANLFTVVSKKTADTVFSWAPIVDAVQYEVVVNKVDVNGNVLVYGYDNEASPFWAKGLGDRALVLNTNQYRPAFVYEAGYYSVLVRAKLNDDSLSPWVVAADSYVVTDLGQKLSDTGFAWTPIENATQYEIVVDKIDATGKVLVYGYDVDATPFWNKGVGAAARVVSSNHYVPARPYEQGYYKYLIRAKLSDDTISPWQEGRDVITVSDDPGVVFSWRPVLDAVAYEAIVDKKHEDGRADIYRYDITATPFWSRGLQENATTITGNYYQPAFAYHPGFYDVTVRAKLSDGSFSDWKKVYSQHEILDSGQTIKDTGIAWASFNDAKQYEVVIDQVDIEGKAKLYGYDVDATPFWAKGLGDRAIVLKTNRYIPGRDYQPGYYSVLVRAQLSDDTLTPWKRVYKVLTVMNSGQTLQDTGFVWTPMRDMIQYEVVVDKISETGKILQYGYDIEAAPFWENGLGDQAKVLRTNWFVPSKKYEVGNYRVLVRGVDTSGQLTAWKVLHKNLVVSSGDAALSLGKAKLTLSKIDNAVQYELIVDKVDEEGKVLVYGYDIDATPWWSKGLGAKAKVVKSRVYTASRPYHTGYYNILYRAKLADGSLSEWSSIEGLYIENSGFQDHELGFVWSPVKDAVQYELIVDRVNEAGGVKLYGYDIDATPFWAKGLGDKAEVVYKSIYTPKREYDLGFYNVAMRARLKDGSLSNWKQIYTNYEVTRAPSRTIYSWRHEEGASQYEVLVDKLDADGKVLVYGYDMQATPFWGKGLADSATVLEKNYYESPIKYEPGIYKAIYRFRTSDGSLSPWKTLGNEFTIADDGSTINNYGFAWSPIAGATQYEVLVDKADVDGNVLTYGYDVSATPWWSRGLGSEAKVISTNHYVPGFEYDSGYYNVSMRAKLSDGSLTAWTSVVKAYNVK